MKSLKDVFSKKMLDDLINQFPVKFVTIYKSESVVTVKSLKGEKLISATSNNGKQWSVQAKDKLLAPECYWSNNLSN